MVDVAPDGVQVPVLTTPPLDVANTFIQRHGGVAGIQHMKLQKLVYYCHGWWLSHYDQPFLQARPEVWKRGPVFNSLYHELKGAGWRPIHSPQTPSPFIDPPVVQDEEVTRLVDWIWAKYGGYSAEELSERTHAPGTPWRIMAESRKYRVPMHTEIPDDLMKQCFRGDPQQVLLTQ